jgi:hypothetical protein
MTWIVLRTTWIALLTNWKPIRITWIIAGNTLIYAGKTWFAGDMSTISIQKIIINETHMTKKRPPRE